VTAAHGAEIAAAAERLRHAYESGVATAPVRSELPPDDISAAYAVQLTNTRFWTDAGRRVVGRKIGLTSEAVQRQLGVDQPDFGALFDDMMVEDKGSIPCDAVLQPRAEAEVAMILGKAIAEPCTSLDEVEAAVGLLVPAIEIVGSRIADWDITIVDTIADNASSGMFVLGSQSVEPHLVDLAASKKEMTIDGEQASTGSGAACLGHPYNAALWLANRMIIEGTPLQEGDIVMSGALGPMKELPPGSTASATIEGLGSVQVTRAEVKA